METALDLLLPSLSASPQLVLLFQKQNKHLKEKKERDDEHSFFKEKNCIQLIHCCFFFLEAFEKYKNIRYM